MRISSLGHDMDLIPWGVYNPPTNHYWQDAPTMRLPPFRFTIRKMLLAVAIVALGAAAYERYFREGILSGYQVGDLVEPSPEQSVQCERLIQFSAHMRSSVMQDVWWSPRRSVTPFFLGNQVVVLQTPEGHRQVSAWLQHQRERKQNKNP